MLYNKGCDRNMIEDAKIILAFIWVALMLVFLLGDVLRIFAGAFTPGEIDGEKFTQTMWFTMSIMMLTPIIMIILSLVLESPVNNWVNIIVALFWIVLNLGSIKGYKAPDQFLLIVSMGLNILTIVYAWI